MASIADIIAPVMARKVGRLSVRDIMLVRDYREIERIIKARAPVYFAPLNRSDIGHVEIGVPFDWASDPYNDRNWCGQLHSWRMFDNYFILAYQNDDLNLLVPIVQVALDWHRFHAVGRRGAFSWKDGIVGPRAMKVALLQDLASQGAIEATREIEEIWETHIRWLSDPANLRMSNHGILDIHGLMALAVAHPDHPLSVHARETVADVLPKIVAAQYDDAGLHREHSPEYHFFALRYFELMAETGWYAQLGGFQAMMARIETMSRWLRMPDGRYVPIGDTTAGPAGFHERPWRSLSPSMLTLNESGYVIHRSQWHIDTTDASFLAVMGAFNSRIHKHGDDLSVLWSEQGIDVLVDHGKFAYKNDAFTSFFNSSLAHNTVSIENTPHLIHNGRIYGTAINRVEELAWGIRVEGQVKHKQPAGLHHRTVLYAPGTALVLIDRLSAPRAQRFTSWLHFSRHAELSATADGYDLVLGPNVFRIAWASNASVEALAAKGETDPIQGWTSEAYADRQPAWALGLESPARANWLLVTVIACPGTPIDELTLDGNSLRLAVGSLNLAETLEWS